MADPITNVGTSSSTTPPKPDDDFKPITMEPGKAKWGSDGDGSALKKAADLYDVYVQCYPLSTPGEKAIAKFAEMKAKGASTTGALEAAGKALLREEAKGVGEAILHEAGGPLGGVVADAVQVADRIVSCSDATTKLLTGSDGDEPAGVGTTIGKLEEMVHAAVDEANGKK